MKLMFDACLWPHPHKHFVYLDTVLKLVVARNTFFAKVLKHKYSWCSLFEMKSNLLGISTPCSLALAAYSITVCSHLPFGVGFWHGD